MRQPASCRPRSSTSALRRRACGRSCGSRLPGGREHQLGRVGGDQGPGDGAGDSEVGAGEHSGKLSQRCGGSAGVSAAIRPDPRRAGAARAVSRRCECTCAHDQGAAVDLDGAPNTGARYASGPHQTTRSPVDTGSSTIYCIVQSNSAETGRSEVPGGPAASAPTPSGRHESAARASLRRR